MPDQTQLAPFTMDASASVDQIIEKLAEFGVVRIPSYLGAQEITALRGEFEALFRPGSSGGVEVFPDYSTGRGLALQRDVLDQGAFPAVAQVFSSEKFRAIKDRFLGRKATLCSEIYLTHDFKPESWITGVHFDRIRTLKFFLYLSEATETAGAFRCAPRSHLVSRRIANAFVGRGGRIRDLPNQVVPPEVGPVIPMEGPAGTLVIFDTDVFHQGGQLVPGKERIVMRGHCFPVPGVVYHPRRFSRQWLWESSLNPVRFLSRLGQPAS